MKFGKIVLFSLITLLVSVASAQRVIITSTPSSSIDKFLETADIFNMSRDTFESEWLKQLGLTWTDKFKRTARSDNPLNYYDMQSLESIFKFKSEKFTKATMMIYNKGDQGEMTKTKFDQLLKDTYEKIQKIIDVKGGFKPGDEKRDNTNIYFWIKMPYLYRLEYSYSMVRPYGQKFAKPEFSPEFIRLVVSKGDIRINAVNVDMVDTLDILSDVEIKEMVVADTSGGVVIEGVPMVDQGQKGYCACASVARILNFYGRDVDQHDIAKMALSSGEGGTDPELLKKAIDRISSSMRLNMKVVVKCPQATQRERQRFYDKLDRELVKQGLSLAKGVRKDEISPFFKDMSEKDGRYKEFQKGIKEAIDKGRPLAWALMLGIIIEPEIPQAEGGHMRLIIGYNEQTEEIYYTDSWGKGHELKKMKAYNAFYTSMALWEISPR
jgi:hypothetical protein